MNRDLFSYWLTVTGEYSQCKKFHQDLKACGVVPEILQQNVSESKVHVQTNMNSANKEPSTIYYQVDETTGVIEEVDDIFEQINHIVCDYPDLIVSLECVDEDDHTRQGNYVWYKNKCCMDHAHVEIKTVERLRHELEAELEKERKT